MGKWLLLLAILLLAGCTSKDENLAAYYELMSSHDTKQVAQIDRLTATIRGLSDGVPFASNTERAMYAVIQALLVADVQYHPLDVAPPTTANDFWVRNFSGLLEFASPFAWWAIAGGGGDETGPSYSTGDNGTILVNSGNAGSYNAGTEQSITGAVDWYSPDPITWTYTEQTPIPTK